MGAEKIGLEFVGRWWWWVSLILVLSRQWGGWFCAYGMGGFGGMYLSCGQHVRWRHSITWQSAYLLLVSPKIEISIRKPNNNPEIRNSYRLSGFIYGYATDCSRMTTRRELMA